MTGKTNLPGGSENRRRSPWNPRKRLDDLFSMTPISNSVVTPCSSGARSVVQSKPAPVNYLRKHDWLTRTRACRRKRKKLLRI